MSSAGIEIEGKDVQNGVVFVGFQLDTTYGQPNWIIWASTDEDELKKDMLDEGAVLPHSFVVKVNVPDVSNVKKTVEQIRTLDLTKGEVPLTQ